MIKAYVVIALLVTGCTTRFYGDPKVEGGVSGCVAKCSAWGMELAGMVAMGEYSEACICQVRGKQASLAAPGAGGTVVAVEQMTRASQQGAAASSR